MKLAVVLLAAGDSKRFGSNKLLHIVDNKEMYRHIVDTTLELHPQYVDKIILVTQYKEIIDSYEDNKYITVIENTNSSLGISHSVKLGLGEANDYDAVMYCVCDQPYLHKESIKKLIEQFIESDKKMACLGFEEEMGNPTMFLKDYFPHINMLTGDIGGKSIIKEHLSDTLIVEASLKQEIIDIDTNMI